MARRAKKRGRRRYRRNAGFRFGGGGMVNKIIGAAKNAGYVVVGKAIARGVPRMVGLPTTGLMGTAVQALAGIFLAPIVGKFIGRGSEPFIIAGALVAPMEQLLAGLPVVGPLLGEYDYLAAIPQDLGPSDLISQGDEDDVLAMGGYANEGMSGYLSPVF